VRKDCGAHATVPGRLRHAIVLVLALWSLAVRAEPEATRIDVVGTAFQVTEADGRVLSGDALAGAVLNIRGNGNVRLQIRIGSVHPDGNDPDGEVVLYELQSWNDDRGGWTNVCQPGPDGLALGFPLAGSMSPDGRYVPTPGSFTLTCTTGVMGKCVRLGYKPWASTAGGVPLLDTFRACTRMFRADYCGDGVPHTREGTPIDVFDALGIQKSESPATMSFEAAWDADGAVCVKKTRIPELLPLADLPGKCPERLRDRLGEDCNAGRATILGRPLLMNNS